MCKKDDEALRLLWEVVTGEVGDNQHTEGTSNRSTHGTTKDYTLDRLVREDPELYEKVVAEEMDRLRSTVKDLLNPDAAGHGGDRKSEEAQDQLGNTNLNSSKNDESYALRRLKVGAHGLTLRTSQPKLGRLSPRKPIRRCYQKTAW